MSGRGAGRVAALADVEGTLKASMKEPARRRRYENRRHRGLGEGAGRIVEVSSSAPVERNARAHFADRRIEVERRPGGSLRKNQKIKNCNRERLGQRAGRKAFVARGVRDGADLLLDRGLLHVELLQIIRGITSAEPRFWNQRHVLRGGFLMHGRFRGASFRQIGLQSI